ncbi:phosphonate ABC transporter substrate-binding protein [Pollutimonas subterranea]|uniref:Phosphonate ABC transporter substrate-binding protein n=1 Tax=Pollutimonas subterranea TaxID=2045210 RepID=A0A2N4TZ26_9BURK|nr:phosphate/phosphite/phosphonate ABC transporter substrate-binding protein [Pollutimonas subterranea]PLC48017.1 phosphonate ABC transporter substrate-binding protein [Pollutimonas subterranea]
MSKIAFGLCAVFLFAATAGAAQEQVCSNPATLRLAIIPQMKDQTAVGRYDALIETLQDELDRNVVLVPAGSYGAVIEGLFDGSIDLAELGPGSYALARDRGANITAFASLHKQIDASGPSNYHSVLITRKDAGIQSLDVLRGSALSLVDPVSTSGGIVPRVAVRRMTGMHLETWFGRVSFAGSHDLAIDAVLNGRVAAAFVADTRVKEGVYNGRPAADALHIIWRSDPIPADPFVYQVGLCEPVRQAIHRVFFERQDDLQPLFAWRDRQGFVPVSDSDYQLLMAEKGVD